MALRAWHLSIQRPVWHLLCARSCAWKQEDSGEQELTKTPVLVKLTFRLMEVNRLSRASICTFNLRAPVPQMTGCQTEAGAEGQSPGWWEEQGSDQQPHSQEGVLALPAHIHPTDTGQLAGQGTIPKTGYCVCTCTHVCSHRHTPADKAGTGRRRGRAVRALNLANPLCFDSSQDPTAKRFPFSCICFRSLKSE